MTEEMTEEGAALVSTSYALIDHLDPVVEGMATLLDMLYLGIKIPRGEIADVEMAIYGNDGGLDKDKARLQELASGMEQFRDNLIELVKLIESGEHPDYSGGEE